MATDTDWQQHVAESERLGCDPWEWSRLQLGTQGGRSVKVDAARREYVFFDVQGRESARWPFGWLFTQRGEAA